MHRNALAAIVATGVLALVLGSGCGGGEEADPAPVQVPPAAPPSTDEPAPAPPSPAAPPDPEPLAGAVPACEVPEGELAGDCAVGAATYAQLCALCHGPGGKGDGPGAVALDTKPRDHTDTAYMSALDDAHLYRVVKCGGPAVGRSPAMAAWGSALTDEQIRGLVCHLRELSGT